MADTTAYLYLGLASIVVIMGALMVSMVTRQRSLKNDEETLKRLAQDD